MAKRTLDPKLMKKATESGRLRDTMEKLKKTRAAAVPMISRSSRLPPAEALVLKKSVTHPPGGIGRRDVSATHPDPTKPRYGRQKGDPRSDTPSSHKPSLGAKSVKKASGSPTKGSTPKAKAGGASPSSKPQGTPLAMKNTYTTSGTHAGGRKSSASRPIAFAKSLKKKGTSLRAQ